MFSLYRLMSILEYGTLVAGTSRRTILQYHYHNNLLEQLYVLHHIAKIIEIDRGPHYELNGTCVLPFDSAMEPLACDL